MAFWLAVSTKISSVSRSTTRVLRSFARDSDVEPIQFLFDLVKGIVSDFVIRTHGENLLPRRVKCSAVNPDAL